MAMHFVRLKYSHIAHSAALFSFMQEVYTFFKVAISYYTDMKVIDDNVNTLKVYFIAIIITGLLINSFISSNMKWRCA
jgi:hypothetical protein